MKQTAQIVLKNKPVPRKEKEVNQLKLLYQLNMSAKDTAITLRLNYNVVRACFANFKTQEIPVLPPGQLGDLLSAKISFKDIKEYLNGIPTTERTTTSKDLDTGNTEV